MALARHGAGTNVMHERSRNAEARDGPGMVLVVDPQPEPRARTVEWLSGAGYEAVGIDAFEAARVRLRADRPALVIADVRLGPFNGLQLALAARSMQPPVPA